MRVLSRLLVLRYVSCLNAEPHEQGSQHRKDIRLDECDEELQQADAYREQDRADSDGKGSEQEDEAQERKYDDVSPRHIGKQTDAESERFCEQAENLDRHHDWPENRMHAPRKMGKILREALRANGGDLNHDERNHGESRGHSNVAGRRGPVRYQAEQIHHQDEKKRCQKVWDIPEAGRTNFSLFSIFRRT